MFEWFLPHAAGFRHVLEETGSFVFDIRMGLKTGNATTFVMELIFALRKNEVGFQPKKIRGTKISPPWQMAEPLK